MCFTKDTQSYFIVDNLQFKKILLHFRISKSGPDPERSNTGGHRMSMYGICGVSRKGGEYERGLPLSYRGARGISPGGKIWEIVVPEKRFSPVLGQSFRFQT